MKQISILWEIPLAILSFIFYKINKFIIGNIFRISLTINKKKATQWRVIDAETLKSFLVLPVVMTKGPRWNTHAIIGTLGPIYVEKTIALDLKSANKSAQSWIAVIYSFPSYETITNIKSKENNQDTNNQQWETLNLQPGQYTIALRYYHWSDSIEMPAINVDEKMTIGKQPVAQNINQFYQDLIQKKNWYYLWLHYYIYTILYFRDKLGENWIAREYLPVGAPDTTFLYNYLEKGQSLEVEINSEVLNHNQLYLTIYDHCSLPISWQQLKEEKNTITGIENNGFYLIRIRPKDETILGKIEIEKETIQKLKIIRKSNT